MKVVAIRMVALSFLFFTFHFAFPFGQRPLVHLSTFHYKVHRLLHRAGGLHHLGEEHASFAKQAAHMLHTCHEGAFDDGYCRGVHGECLLQVGLEGVARTLDEGVLEAVLEGDLSQF